MIDGSFSQNIDVLLVEDDLGDADLIEDYLDSIPEFSFELKRCVRLQEALQRAKHHLILFYWTYHYPTVMG
ncbi:hypothetical protein [Oxynema sp. CENA135]|uniref:hypothetical protein n=1 Tax=Oxynema sp. CENA135 TaxID=984206 RepID=UPI001F488202|nr:hypothetical protein [Oxynema sp. CENA135]